VTPSKDQPIKPAWLPDWNNISHYPNPKVKKVPGKVWAWEFLRRNPKYQQLWEAYAALPKSAGFIYGGSAVLDIRERFQTEFGVYPAPPPISASDPDFERLVRFVNQSPPYWMWPADAPEDYEFQGPDLNHPAEVLMKFDLRLQIAVQVKGANAILKKEASRLSKAGTLSGQPRSKSESGKYCEYLRVLDAKMSGATSKVIAKEILGITDEDTLKDTQSVKEKVDDVFKAAKRLRDGGFCFLAARG
jgi:hypothetical protein